MEKVYVIGRDEVPSQLKLEHGESLKMTLVVLPHTSAALDMQIDLDSADCDVDIAGVYICRADESLSLRINLRHNVGGCRSRQLFKGIVGGSSRTVFNGLIYVAPNAQKTSASQTSHTILMSRDARVESSPQLEIYADDVECSHGSTSGFLNLEEQFYMRSRGIPEEEAVRLQKLAFIAPVAERLPEEIAKELYENIA